MELILLMFLIVISVIVSTMCYEFYTTGKVNRYKFRYWFAIGVLNIFHLLLAVYFIITGDDTFQSARWATFAMMNVLFLEIFMYKFKHRVVELYIRVGYYYAVLLAPVLMNWIIDVGIAVTLMILAYTGGQTLKNYFTTTFFLYGMTTVIPVLFGFGTTTSFLSGVVFMSHMMYGVYKLYKIENVEELLIEKIIEDGEEYE